MNFLLDTQILLWWFISPKKIPAKVSKQIANGQRAVWFSAASLWEIEIKRGLGKLRAPDDILEVAAQSQFSELTITGVHALALRDLPLIHHDPFDRMLVAQARTEGLTLVTSDRLIQRYSVSTLAV
jgi:PIN domain nuclease of toxin-antitoxin system